MRRGRGRSLHLMRGRSCPTKEGGMTMHALGEDREHCVCGMEFPCAGWVAQQSDLEPMARLDCVDLYAELVPPHVTERLRAALTKEMG